MTRWAARRPVVSVAMTRAVCTPGVVHVFVTRAPEAVVPSSNVQLMVTTSPSGSDACAKKPAGEPTATRSDHCVVVNTGGAALWPGPGAATAVCVTAGAARAPRARASVRARASNAVIRDRIGRLRLQVEPYAPRPGVAHRSLANPPWFVA